MFPSPLGVKGISTYTTMLDAPIYALFPSPLGVKGISTIVDKFTGDAKKVTRFRPLSGLKGFQLCAASYGSRI